MNLIVFDISITKYHQKMASKGSIICRIIGFIIGFTVFAGCATGAAFAVLAIKDPSNYCTVLAVTNVNCYADKIEQFFALDNDRTGIIMCGSEGVCQPNWCTQRFVVNETYPCGRRTNEYYTMGSNNDGAYIGVAFLCLFGIMSLAGGFMALCINEQKTNQEIEMTDANGMIKPDLGIQETNNEIEMTDVDGMIKVDLGTTNLSEHTSVSITNLSEQISTPTTNLSESQKSEQPSASTTNLSEQVYNQFIYQKQL